VPDSGREAPLRPSLQAPRALRGAEGRASQTKTDRGRLHGGRHSSLWRNLRRPPWHIAMPGAGTVHTIIWSTHRPEGRFGGRDLSEVAGLARDGEGSSSPPGRQRGQGLLGKHLPAEPTKRLSDPLRDSCASLRQMRLADDGGFLVRTSLAHAATPEIQSVPATRSRASVTLAIRSRTELLLAS
jgi:hypothetical protein